MSPKTDPGSVMGIGRPPGLTNAHFITGHQMTGVMTAPATGRLVAEFISRTEFISREEPHIDASAFSPKPISLNFR